MYNAYWGLKEKPFENNTDTRFTFLTPQHEEGIARLLYAVRESKPLALLSGVYGCGKTFLGKCLFRELEKEAYRTAFLPNSRMDYVELLMTITKGLGGQDLPTKRSDILTNILLDRFQQTVLSHARDGRKSVVILDEAHTIMDDAVWEGLRLLLNFQEDVDFTLIFIGHLELKEKVHANKALLQRVSIRCHLDPLSPNETRNYILHRLKVAGRDEPVFTEEAFSLIHTHSGGIPRRVNTLCDLALLTGLERYLKRIDPDCIQDVVRDIEG